MRVICVFGTRPEAIKMAPVVSRLRRDPLIQTTVCVTGQHREMLTQVLDLFDITPDINLDVMVAGQTLNGLSARVLSGMDDVFNSIRPDRVLVHGDTTTTMAASLAAFHWRIPIGHVEAGLRTYDLKHPFPEEMNRRIVDVAADLHFAPTTLAASHLASEQLAGRILVTGNTVIDALQEAVAKIKNTPRLRESLEKQFSFLDSTRRLILVTAHRRENFGAGFEGICEALARIAERSDVEILYPVHRNPNVTGPVFTHLSGRGNIHLIDPLSYYQFVYLMERAFIILTDSGGVQEEAPTFGKPVLVLRSVTERPEAVAAGTVRLVGTNSAAIVEAVMTLCDDPAAYARFAQAVNPYGDGHAAERIHASLLGRPVEAFEPGRRVA
ncbi:non-hydrolyzing UDP-N-acetylglucosamine 2-epimerase [Beijerinckia mobilis]|uniref:non-hydrolyzing UDP-N-acetylglucosamine 2-epimerase n=1 Tax=Beijerinckia mobilis TaxID=231434 RepID=UPI000551E7EB|nr:UDP-N-acetylglucosamine 2-epimerase (non-hydrolyzing) [Beijerinckia mobilis]